MARAGRPKYVPMVGDEVLAPPPDDKTKIAEEPATVIYVNRPEGVMGATVSYKNPELKALPDGGLRWHRARNLKFVRRRGGASRVSTRPQPSRGAVLQERLATIAGDSSAEKPSLQTEPLFGTVSRGAKRRRRSKSTPQGGPHKMATTTRGRKRASTKEEPETTTKSGRKGRSKAAEKEAPAKATGNGRRTHEDILELVPEIVEKLRDGTTMTDIRAEYGAGPVIRKALAEKGYNTKGERVEVENLTNLKGKQLAKAVANLREDGKAWYYIELATDMAQADLQDLLEENGYEHLATGRVILTQEEDEEPVEEKPARTKRTKRGSAKTEEAEPTAKASTSKRGRKRGKANPSTDES